MNIRFYTRAKLLGLCLFTLFLSNQSFAQVTYSANDQVTPYYGDFRAGYNIGYHPGWTDKTLSNLAAGNPALGIAGVGARSTRQGLFFGLFNDWGYPTRIGEMQHYQSLGMGDMTALILGGAQGGSQPYPPDAVRDLTEYCAGHPSELFKNMYEPIWDGGANGTPYNENNPYAVYIYKTVDTYKDYVRFWEIWNEPGFDYSGSKGWRLPGDPIGNWWDNNPEPCDYRLRAPIQHYVRMMRISWEVIKTLDPDSYVTCGAPGFPSFLDAILRNTDNPNGGAVSADFPLKGGAYFDALAYHAYPHFDGAVVLDPFTQTFMRNSDRAATGVVEFRDRMQTVLANRGYNGTMFPKKEFIITESNLPRRTFSDASFYGNDEYQRNFMIKAAINCKVNSIHQFHVYTIAETQTESNANYEFHAMGLYKNIDNLSVSQVQVLPSGIGLRTVSTLLKDSYLDGFAASLLNPPAGVKCYVFKKTNNRYVAAMWAETKTDKSETASATYAFPTGYQFGTITKLDWDYGQTGVATPIQATQSIALTGAPIFLEFDQLSVGTEVVNAAVNQLAIWPNPAQSVVNLSFSLEAAQNVRIETLNVLGQKVQTVFDGRLKAGTQQFDFQEKSGIYFVKIQTEIGQVSRRIIIE